jgi:hypothetical protein
MQMSKVRERVKIPKPTNNEESVNKARTQSSKFTPFSLHMLARLLFTLPQPFVAANARRNRLRGKTPKKLWRSIGGENIDVEM